MRLNAAHFPGIHCRILLTGWILAYTAAATPFNGELVDKLLAQSSYNRDTRPMPKENEPVHVTIDMFINDVSSVDEVKMDFQIQVFLRQRWIDPRLKFTNSTEPVSLNYRQSDSIWLPDLFVKNEKSAIFHEITVPNRLIRLSPNGEILYSQRLTLVLECDMHLARYPLDNQTCTVQLESYGLTTKDLVFQWKEEDPVQLRDNLQLPEFLLKGRTVGDCTGYYITGSFSCVVAELFLQRQLEFYLIQTYIPSILIVSLSWVSFWIDYRAVPARISLGLLTVLTMTTQSTGTSQRLPRVSYIKAIDVWMSVCLAFVFGALIEYSVVNVLARTKKGEDEYCSNCGNMKATEENKSQHKENEFCACLAESSPVTSRRENGTGIRNKDAESSSSAAGHQNKPRGMIAGRCWSKFWHKVCDERAQTLDTISRGAFPGLFILFNILYWTLYTSAK